MAVFERVGFRDPKRMLTTYPFELSGGMRQRAMIAMALICKPALLIADEPTTALDVTTQAQILALIKELQAETGMGVLLITHDLGVVANMADEVVVMYRGEVMERGTREEIFRSPQHPYLKALMRAVPRFDMTPGERLTPIREIKVDAAAAAAAAHGERQAASPAGRTVLEITGRLARPSRCAPARFFGKTETRPRAVQRQPLDPGRHDGGPGRRIRLGQDDAVQDHHARAWRPTAGTVRFDDGTGPRDVFALQGHRS